MKIKQLILFETAGLIILFSLSGCEDDAVRSVGYRSQESVEHRAWLINEENKMVDSISQAYNRQSELSDKIIRSQLETRDSDIESMNERYSYSQNLTDKGL